MKTERKRHDPVHSPSHYTSGAVECIDAIEAALGPEGFIAFLRGQVIRYNWRMGLKEAPVQEAGKAKWYMDLLTKRLGAGQANWPQSPQQPQKQPQQQQQQPIQSEALTDKKEMTNGTDDLTADTVSGTWEMLRSLFGSGPIMQRAQSPGGVYTYYVPPGTRYLKP